MQHSVLQGMQQTGGAVNSVDNSVRAFTLDSPRDEESPRDDSEEVASNIGEIEKKEVADNVIEEVEKKEERNNVVNNEEGKKGESVNQDMNTQDNNMHPQDMRLTPLTLPKQAEITKRHRQKEREISRRNHESEGDSELADLNAKMVLARKGKLILMTDKTLRVLV
jgi:hypothetical protein